MFESDLTEHAAGTSPAGSSGGARRLSESQLSSLRRALPGFSEALNHPRAEALTEYASYYGIDFDRQMPDVSHHMGLVKSGAFSLSTQLWRHPKPQATVLVVHGYFDHSAMYGHLVRYALERGCNALSFDLPGHGLSSGARASIDDFAHYSQAVADVMAAGDDLASPWIAFAQSTGGAALIDLAARRPWPFNAC
ncbi:MAG: alpha/beta fold hydrolase, partial [Pseudomonadota bacterium]